MTEATSETELVIDEASEETSVAVAPPRAADRALRTERIMFLAITAAIGFGLGLLVGDGAGRLPEHGAHRGRLLRRGNHPRPHCSRTWFR